MPLKIKTLLANLALLAISTTLALVLGEVLVRQLDLLPAERAAAAQQAEDRGTKDQPLTKFLLHPYRGWTHWPVAEDEYQDFDSPDNLFGFSSNVRDFRDLEESDFVVGIFGGSVARGIALRAGRLIEKRIAELRPELTGQVHVINVSMGGYKQPQQLFALQEMLLLGVPLDVVINVDGFNEVALGRQDALRSSHPLLPFSNNWKTTFDFGRGVLTETQVELTAQVIAHRRRAEDLRRWVEGSWLGRSQLVRALVGSLIRNAVKDAVLTEQRLSELPEPEGRQTAMSLGDPCLGDEGGCLDLIATIWQDASTMMNTLAEQSGALYLHALQPNQYIEGSKQLTEEELQEAYVPTRPWSQGAVLGYPVLQSRAETLRQRGVDYHDLTMIFENHAGTLYRDSCCHVFPEGSQIIGERLAKLVDAAMTRRGAAASVVEGAAR